MGWNGITGSLVAVGAVAFVAANCVSADTWAKASNLVVGNGNYSPRTVENFSGSPVTALRIGADGQVRIFIADSGVTKVVTGWLRSATFPMLGARLAIPDGPDRDEQIETAERYKGAIEKILGGTASVFGMKITTLSDDDPRRTVHRQVQAGVSPAS